MDVEEFIANWRGAAVREIADGHCHIIQLCRVLGVAAPNDGRAGDTDYAFERSLIETTLDGARKLRRADCYRKGSFVLEMKGVRERTCRGRKARRGDCTERVLGEARQQAETFAKALPDPPPFLVVINIGRSIELWANFGSPDGAYRPFPDPERGRIAIEDLRDPAIRDRLAAVWTQPRSLDPTDRVEKVTRTVAGTLTRLAPAIGARLAAEVGFGMPIDPVHRLACSTKATAFLSQCILAIFADSIGIFQDRSFLQLIRRYRTRPGDFHRAANQLFAEMRQGGFSVTLEQWIPPFESGVLRQVNAIALTADELETLAVAAAYDWSDVDPTIFGVLLETAIAVGERAACGVHYTEQASVERLVKPTVMEVLQEGWARCLAVAEDEIACNRIDQARRHIVDFHRQLLRIRVLDPACGSGNFLFVAMKLMQGLEAEVLGALMDLGDDRGLHGVCSRRVSRKQFLGMDIEPRAVCIAQLVMTIGELRSRSRRPGGLSNIEDPVRDTPDVIVQMDALLSPGISPGQDFSATARVTSTPWPEADFIVGNPPYLGASQMRGQLGDAYVDALWAVNAGQCRSADLVTRWWSRAAEILEAPGSRLKRFGFITTRSITQTHSRPVLNRHLGRDATIRLVFAIADHPWVSRPRGPAVRVAMTVAERGAPNGSGRLMRLARQMGEADRELLRTEAVGVIGPDLRIVEPDLSPRTLRANARMAARGSADGRGVSDQHRRCGGPVGPGRVVATTAAATLSQWSRYYRTFP